jgi:hypothetical protein
MAKKRMDARIPVTGEVKSLVRAFADGAGVTYDDLLRHWLRESGIEMNEQSAVAVGSALRGVIPSSDKRESK